MRWLNVMLLVIVLFPHGAHAQTDSLDYLPDGTQGEMLEVVKADSVPAKWRDKRWRLFPGKISTLKLGGGFLYEFAGYVPDKIAKQQMDSAGTSLDPEFKVRDFRIVASGQFKTKRTITWKAGFMYDAPSGSWFVRETGVMIHIPEISGSVFVGRTKEGFSLNKVMNGYAGWTMERQMAIDVIPILADGIKYLGYLPKPRIVWNVGAFADWLSKSQSFSTFHYQFITRVGYLPVYKPAENVVAHVALNYRYGDPENHEMRLRSRPEANPSPYFIDTGKFGSTHSNQYGYESYLNYGSWFIGSEFYVHKFTSPEGTDFSFTGGEAVVSYIFTGESRVYNPATAIFGFVPVKRSVFKGGPGAFEGVLRWSTLDLNSHHIKGGSLWRITPMVNWYLSKDVRLELAYGYAILNRYSLKGAVQIFQARLQLTLL